MSDKRRRRKTPLGLTINQAWAAWMANCCHSACECTPRGRPRYMCRHPQAGPLVGSCVGRTCVIRAEWFDHERIDQAGGAA